ncbi:MAG: amidohydrolase family protein, partial [Myxococcota bacterium]|nr:amidohydrolase family protein [Myxococcota bacterium]
MNQRLLMSIALLSTVGCAHVDAGLDEATCDTAASALPAGGTDFHVHIHPYRHEGMSYNAKRAELALNSAGLTEAVAISTSYQRVANPACRKAGVEGCPLDRKWVQETNDWTAEEAKRVDFRWHFFCGVPLGADWAIEEMRRCKQIGAAGFKVHTLANRLSLRQSDVYGEVGGILAEAERLDLPVLVHASFGDPEETTALITLINASPNTRVILGHALYREWTRLPEITSKNVVVELSVAVLKMAKAPEQAVALMRSFGMERFVFGSDWPV